MNDRVATSQRAQGDEDLASSLPSQGLSMQGMHKRYGDLVAVNEVDLDITPGRVHAIVGENGAGKSTLMEMLAGSVRADAGTITVDGEVRRIRSVGDAYAAGIGIVHQHFQLFPGLTVAENIVLGDEPRRLASYDSRRAAEIVEELGERYGLRVRANARVGTLSVGDQQRVEILRALYRGARILILDEPTAVLTPQESEGLFEIIREIRDAQRTVLFVSHKLREVLAIADEITVMRRGVVTGRRHAAETNAQELTELMVGRNVALERTARPSTSVVGDVVLRAEGLSAEGLDGLDLQVRAGEILGISGVDGNGQSELAEVLTGLRPLDSGQIVAEAESVYRRGTARSRGSAFGYIPDDRYARGLAREASIAENLMMGNEKSFARHGVLDRHQIHNDAEQKVRDFDIRATGANDAVGTLSGGNAQKVTIARELSGVRHLVIASQPTRGLDVGAAEFVHAQLRRQRDNGCAILLISADLDEIRVLSDRIVVMYEGKVVGEVSGENSNEQEIGLLMAGIGGAS